MNKLAGIGMAALALALSSCSLDYSITDGTVVDKQYHEACVVTEIMGTASGALAYDRKVPEAYTLTVTHEKPSVDGDLETVEWRFRVSEADYARYDVGDEFAREYVNAYTDQCD